ncbi:MAG: hypothetical protein EOP88_17970, partial [Verrucomicrobiaceae bacterium]
MRLLGITSILLGALTATGEIMGLALPTARWFFEVSRGTPVLGGTGFPWFGWLSVILLCGWGLMTVIRTFTSGPPNPVTVRRIRRFRDVMVFRHQSVVGLAAAGFMIDALVLEKLARAGLQRVS